jgi:hypothetical protein
VGAPKGLLSDNAKSETSKEVKRIQRKYMIQNSQTEPHHPNQNYAERCIQEVKGTTNLIMDRTGAAPALWFLCMAYVVYLLNHLSIPRLKNKTATEAAFGITDDVSALMHFYFLQPVLYNDSDVPFPTSKEKAGYWVGVAEHCGDALTWQILTADTNQVIKRSVVRPDNDPQSANLRVSPPVGELLAEVDEATMKDPLIYSKLMDHIETGRLKLPSIDPDDLSGYHFVKEVNGDQYRAEVIGRLEDTDKFRLQIGEEGNREELIEYNDLLEAIERDLNDSPDDGERLWTFSDILNHRTYQGKQEVLVKWDIGEETWEPLTLMRTQDPVTVAKYAKDNSLLETPGCWKLHTQ